MFVPSFLDMFSILFLSYFCLVELAGINESSPLSSASSLSSPSYDPIYDCLNLYLSTLDFSAFKECVSGTVEDEGLKKVSESITPVHLETIMELFEVCKDEKKNASDVEAIVKSDHFLEPFKDFVPINQVGGPFAGSSYIWTTLTSFDPNFENISAKLKILLGNKFDPFLQAGLSDIVSPLSFASERGMVECVKLLLEYEDVNSHDATGYTPLLKAFRNENVTLINILLQAGADPLFGLEFKPDLSESSTVDPNPDHNDLFDFLAKPLPRDYPFIKRIIEEDNEDIQLSILEGLTPEEKIKMAYFFGFDTALKKLTPDLNDFKWPEGLFKEIIEKKYTELIIALLKDDKLSWTLPTHNLVIELGLKELFPILKEEFFTRKNLTMAAKNGDFAYVALHLDRNLPIYDSLLEAASTNQVKIVELLIIRGRRDIISSYASRALQTAATKGHIECVALLIEKITDISSGHDASWALRDAARNGHVRCMTLLIEKRTDICRDSVGWALEEAAENGHAGCVRLLIERKKRRTDISADHAGRALKEAAENGHAECVKLLIEKRTDISAMRVRWALRYANQNGHADCVTLLTNQLHE